MQMQPGNMFRVTLGRRSISQNEYISQWLFDLCSGNWLGDSAMFYLCLFCFCVLRNILTNRLEIYIHKFTYTHSNQFHIYSISRLLSVRNVTTSFSFSSAHLYVPIFSHLVVGIFIAMSFSTRFLFIDIWFCGRIAAALCVDNTPVFSSTWLLARTDCTQY